MFFFYHGSSRFRWVVCQLETLRRSVQRNLRGILEKLPKTLDETYERILRDINEDNREHARRLLHCLAAAVRPLRVEELAEILAFDFDNVQGGIPKFHAGWRCKDQEEAVLSTCSSLIAIVGDPYHRVVQFSHFSVKEFLTSNRLASPTRDVSRYHILPGHAHTILAQACLGFLLHLDDHVDKESVRRFPLAEYAGQHWVAHAQFENVASRVKDGMRSLFDPDKPYFVSWLGIYNVDYQTQYPPPHVPNPLYYSALCGFHDVVEHLAINHPQLVNAIGNRCGSPLLAALDGKHIQVAEFLLRHGGQIDIRGKNGQTPLHMASELFRGNDDTGDEAVRFLLKHGADVHSRRDDLYTPLHLISSHGTIEAAQMLIERGADVHSRNAEGETPLHMPGTRHFVKDSYVAQLLIERGANVDALDENHDTPLIRAVERCWTTIARILLEHGAEPNVKNNDGKTLLHVLLGSDWGYDDEDGAQRIAQLLLEHGVSVDAQDEDHKTPLHLAVKCGTPELTQTLLEHGADPNMKDKEGKTPLDLVLDGKIDDEENVSAFMQLFLEKGANMDEQVKVLGTPLNLALEQGSWYAARFILERGAEPNMKNNKGQAPLHLLFEGLSFYRYPNSNILGLTRLLLERGADVNARDNDHHTPLHLLSCYNFDDDDVILSLAQLFLERSADVNAQNNDRDTPLCLAIQNEYLVLTRFLLEHGADLNLKNNEGKTPLHLLSKCYSLSDDYDILSLARLLLERGADVNAQDNDRATLLYLAIGRGYLVLARFLLERGADPNLRNNKDKTPLHILLKSKIPLNRVNDVLVVERLLLKSGADVNAQDEDNTTPLHLASQGGEHYSLGNGLSASQVSLIRGVDVNARNEDNTTYLHSVCYFGGLEMVRELLDHGANANVENIRGETPLHLASCGRCDTQEGGVGVVQLLLGRTTNVNAQDKGRITPLHLACYYGRLEIARMLLDHGARINTKDELGQTPLHLVLEGKRSGTDGVSIVHLLLMYGADANDQDDDNETPLHLASHYGKLAIGRLLLTFGANANAENIRGQTPLHVLSLWPWRSGDEFHLVGILVDGGAEVNARDKDDETPMHIAFRNNRLDIAQCLLNRGADIFAENNRGEVPFQLAPRVMVTE